MCSINLPRALKILQVFFIIDSLHVEVLSIVHLQRFLGPLVLQVFDIHRLSVYWTKYKTNEYLSLFWRTTQSWSLQVWILIAYRRVEKQKFTSILQNFSWFARPRMAPKAQVSSTKLLSPLWVVWSQFTIIWRDEQNQVLRRPNSIIYLFTCIRTFPSPKMQSKCENLMK